MRPNDANKMTPTPHHPSCHMRHSQNFNKVNSFLKSVLKMCILGNLIVGWGEWVINNGTGILHQIYRFSGGVIIFGGVGFIKVRVSIVCSFQTPKAKVVFDCKPLTFFIKKLQLEYLTGLHKALPKSTFYVLLVKTLLLEKKKHLISSPVNWFTYNRMLE